MIHMDVDLHSVASDRRRYASIKRARSPEPFLPHERPSKRLALAIGQSDTIPALDNIQRRLGDSSTGSSRHSSEDWVQQTGGLTIDSPICTGSKFPGIGGAERVPVDEDMMMEFTEGYPQLLSIQLDRPQLPHLQTSRYTPFTSGSSITPSHDSNQYLPPITVDSTGPVPLRTALPPGCQQRQQHQQQSLVLGQNTPMGPAINIVPPTPMELQVAQGCHHASLGLGSVANSPNTVTPSSPKLMTPLTSKKQRFAMGPRADCEKCRLGIKGHSVHLD